MTELSGLELRRALAELLGWKIEQTFRMGWRYWLVNPAGTDILSSNLSIESVIERMPAFESDPALSEETLERVCREKGWKWQLSRTRNHDIVICTLTSFDGEGDEHFVSNGRGLNISESIARALLAALRGEKGKL